MELTLRQMGNVTLIRIEGRIDHTTAKDFEDGLKPYLNPSVAGEYGKIVIDLGGVRFITSAGLRVLMIAAKTCENQKREIVIAALQPGVKEIFKIGRFDLILRIFPTTEDALQDLSPDIAAHTTHS